MTTIIETSRLLVKIPVLEDIPYWYNLHTDTDVMKYMGGIKSKETIQKWLESDRVHYEKQGFTMGSVFKKNSHEFIGRAGLVYLNHDDTQPDIEIGYILGHKYWGQGYGTELVLALIDWGFSNLAISRLVAVTRPENSKSRYLLDKCGLHYVKNTVFQQLNFLLYEILKKEF